MSNVEENFKEAVTFIQSKLNGKKPDIALILGSGLGDLADKIESPIILEYTDIPHFKVSKVAGHKNRLVFGQLNGEYVMAQQGRFHFYEGIPMSDLVFPLRVIKLLGAKALIVTNAAGGVNAKFTAGDLMLITDHINNMGTNPLIGENVKSLGPRFPDMSSAYTPDLRDVARNHAVALKINLREGVYFGMSGPSYETPAEIRMLQVLGADAVGMSTVPEVIAASHMGMQVLGISCITNMAAGIQKEALDHGEVIETTKRVREQFESLIVAVLPDVAAAAAPNKQ